MDTRVYFALMCYGLFPVLTSTLAATPRTKDVPPKSSTNWNNNDAPTIIDQFSHTHPDGSYDFRYELSDGNTRYERGYFVDYDDGPSLVVSGYYAYRLEDGRYTTVFYNADRGGYRAQSSTTSQMWRDLPKSIDIPEYVGQNSIEGFGNAQTVSPARTTKRLRNTRRR